MKVVESSMPFSCRLADTTSLYPWTVSAEALSLEITRFGLCFEAGQAMTFDLKGVNPHAIR